jgi:iron complex transport system permease protein
VTAVRQRRPDDRAQHAAIRGRPVRTRWWSARLDERAIAVCIALAAATLALGAWSISVGDFPIPLGDVLATLLGRGSEDAAFIVGTLRLPRMLTGVLIGAAFGMSGAVFQSLARNPLGSPDIIGFTAGAAVGAVSMIVLFGAGAVAVSIGAVAGGLLTALLVYVLAWRRGLQAARLVLVGIGIGFAASAVNDYLLTRADIEDATRATVWLTGSLNGRDWDHVVTVAAALAALGPVVVVLQRRLDRLELGDDAAAALGVPVGRSKLLLVLAGTALAALAVAAAGPVAFVAFVAGPIARRLTRSPGACIVPAAFVGALVVVAADLAARRVFAPTELPVGIATAVMGAPFLLWLLSRQIRTGAL